jgi:hypothetical protein
LGHGHQSSPDGVDANGAKAIDTQQVEAQAAQWRQSLNVIAFGLAFAVAFGVAVGVPTKLPIANPGPLVLDCPALSYKAQRGFGRAHPRRPALGRRVPRTRGPHRRQPAVAPAAAGGLQRRDPPRPAPGAGLPFRQPFGLGHPAVAQGWPPAASAAGGPRAIQWKASRRGE